MSIDARTLRQTVGRFVTGVTVIAIDVEGEIRAMTANSFTSLSLDPPLVLFCLGKDTNAGHQIHSALGFTVSILRHNQRDLSSYFAGAWKEAVPPSFSFTAWEGGPRLDGCVAALGCQMHAIHDGGDHWIVQGQVVALHQGMEPHLPLLFYGGRYRQLDATVHPAPARGDLRLADELIAAYYE